MTALPSGRLAGILRGFTATPKGVHTAREADRASQLPVGGAHVTIFDVQRDERPTEQQERNQDRRPPHNSTAQFRHPQPPACDERIALVRLGPLPSRLRQSATAYSTDDRRRQRRAARCGPRQSPDTCPVGYRCLGTAAHVRTQTELSDLAQTLRYTPALARRGARRPSSHHVSAAQINAGFITTVYRFHENRRAAREPACRSLLLPSQRGAGVSVGPYKGSPCPAP